MSPLVRSAALTGYADLARQVGLDPYERVRAVGLNTACLTELDLKISTEAVRRLLEDSAALSGVENFGLRMAQARRLSNLGALGLAARDAPDMRALLGTVMAHMRLHNEALRLHLQDADGYCTIREDLVVPGRSGMRQSVELSMGALMRIMKIFLGDTWWPLRVCFMHQSPVDPGLHRRLFGTALEFGAEFDGLICRSQDMDTPITSSDPVMAAYAQRQFQVQHTKGNAPVQHDVHQLILILLPTGRCMIDQVARHLGRDRRTLHRQLAAEGTCFTDLVTQTRMALCEHYLLHSTRSLTDIALMLGFAGPGNFSRWHQTQHGCPPSERRRMLRST